MLKYFYKPLHLQTDKYHRCNKNYRHRINIESSNKIIRSSTPSLCSQSSRVLHFTNQDKLETWPGYPTKSRPESGYGFRNGIWTEPVHRLQRVYLLRSFIEKPVFIVVVQQIASQINKHSLLQSDASERCRLSHQEISAKP